MIKVLLVSPIDPKVPGNLKYLVGGESTFTQTLLANPPEGVVYIDHLEALKRGDIEYLPWQKWLWLLVKLRVLPLSSGSQCLLVKKHFDLIHCHAYSLKIEGKTAPVILSDSSSNYLFLRDYMKWPEWRIKIGYFLRRKMFDLLGLMDADTNPKGTKRIIVFSQFAQYLHEKLGVSHSKMEVLPPGLKISNKRKTPIGESRTINILFVGIWFERKGGHLLLEAFERLNKKYRNIYLTIVGEVPKNVKCQMSPIRQAQGDPEYIEGSNVKCINYVPREKLMREFFPKADIFVLVPPKVEGYGFAVVEAMSFGIPVVVSNVCALPELAEDGKCGFVVKSGNVDDLYDKLEVLIKDPKLRLKIGEQAKKRFEEKFTSGVMNKKLLSVYKKALKS